MNKKHEYTIGAINNILELKELFKNKNGRLRLYVIVLCPLLSRGLHIGQRYIHTKRNPSAIFWTVIAFYIYSVYRQSLFISSRRSQFIKIVKSIATKPLVTNCHTATAIIFIGMTF